MRTMAGVLAVVLASTGCGKQGGTIGTGMLVAGGAFIGVGAALEPSCDPDAYGVCFEPSAMLFVLGAVVGLVGIVAIASSSDDSADAAPAAPPRPAPVTNEDMAETHARQASELAAIGSCAGARTMGDKLRALSVARFDQLVAEDAAFARCLTPSSTPLPKS